LYIDIGALLDQIEHYLCFNVAIQRLHQCSIERKLRLAVWDGVFCEEEESQSAALEDLVTHLCQCHALCRTSLGFSPLVA
jgi:hypothetical protein